VTSCDLSSTAVRFVLPTSSHSSVPFD
jgi:hypothetical protein